MAGAFRQMKSMALSDDEQIDWLKDRGAWGKTMSDMPEPPEYPSGLCFTVREENFEALEIGQVSPGETVRFAAMAQVTSANHRMDGCRVEAEIVMLSLGDGKLEKMEAPCPCICLDENDHERLDLDEGNDAGDRCEVGDTLHLMGEAQVKEIGGSLYGGKMLCLQPVKMIVESEDEEAEEAA